MLKDVCTIVVGGHKKEDSPRVHSYHQLKNKYRAAVDDFDTLTRIANLVYTLSDEYQASTYCHMLFTVLFYK